MRYITLVAAAPLRSSPSHRSEMVSQLLFGETCSLLDQQDDFLKVQCSHDRYEGWVQQQQVAIFPETSAGLNTAVVSRLHTQGARVQGWPVMLSPGSECHIPAGMPASGATLAVSENITVHYDTGLQFSSPSASGYPASEIIIEQARQWLGAPYLWGGRSIWGVDCSGLVQVCFKVAGKSISRDASQQAGEGTAIGFLEETIPGDLAFFDNTEGKITHVGILLGAGEILHASGMVRIDRIDHHGIIHSGTGLRTHTLRLIKRFF